MAAPWEKYQQQAPQAAPWLKYQQPQAQPQSMSRMQAAGEGFQQGLSYGLSDEMAANAAASQVRDQQLGQRLRASQSAQPITSDEQARAQFMAEYQQRQQREQAKVGAYDAELGSQRQDLKQAREQYPVTAIASEIAGAVPTSIVGTGAGLVQKGAPLARRAMQSAGEAAIGGAAYGFNTGEGGLQNRGQSAAISGAIAAPIGAAAPYIGNVLANRSANAALKKAAPSIDDLKAAKAAAYQRVDDIGAAYKPEALDTLYDGIRESAEAANINPQIHPKAFATLQQLDNMRGKPMTLTQLDQTRQAIARDVAGATEPAERFFGQRMLNNVDEFIDAAGADQMLAGNADDAAKAVTNARELNTRFRKAEMLGEAEYKATNRAASTGSGGNADNAMRQNIRQILDNPKKRRGFNPDEIAAMEKVVRGGNVQNILRSVGKLSPAGNGLMAALGIGGTMANPLIGALPIAGMAAKSTADNMTKKNIANLLLKVATGGQGANDPLVRSLMQQSGAKAMSPAKKALLEALMRRSAPVAGEKANQLLQAK